MRNPIMVGPRLYLRPGEAEDGRILAAYYHDEPDAGIWFGGRTPYSPIMKAAWLEQSSESTPDESRFSVCRRADDGYLGFVALFNVDYVNRTAETGSYLGPPHRDHGFGTEAKHLLLEYAFGRLHLHLLWSVVWEGNRRSAAALLKQGYRPAGRAHWRGLQGGSYQDELFFDLLHADWRAAHLHWSHTIARGT